MNIPEELVSKIINYINDIQKYKCHICHKKISCIDDHISQSKFKFCSAQCYLFTYDM